MDCRQSEPLLSRYHDRELSRDERTKLAFHLEGCPSCSRQLASIERISRATRSVAMVRPPCDLWDRVAAQLGDARSSPYRF